jgi:ArsR family transcriptional regulator
VDDEAAAAVAKALAHPARLRILRLLAKQEQCMGTELFGDLPLAQSTISQHLAILKEAGIVSSHPLGQANVYCLAPEGVRAFASEIGSIVAAATPCSPDGKECR